MALQGFTSAIRKNKILYYARNLLRQIVPTFLYERLLNKKLAAASGYDRPALLARVDYYNKLETFAPTGPGSISLKEIQMFKSPKAYNFDTYEYTRYFNQDLKASFIFGDVTTVAEWPSIQKSRPIDGNNANAVLLKLDKKRHFIFVNDPKRFSEKKNLLIGRGSVTQPHRMKFMDLYFGHPLCDLGQVNRTGGNPLWLKQKLPISAHLDFKFILSLEGNDVASNLKWIMSSNSIAVMPRPRYETWFMEGTLIPDHHYLLIRDDYADLEERLQYYIEHTAEAEAIVRNANLFVNQFKDRQQEDIISLLVLQKYFYRTLQADRLL